MSGLAAGGVSRIRAVIMSSLIWQVRLLARPRDRETVKNEGATPNLAPTGDRIRAIAGTRIAFRDGVAVSVTEGDFLRPIAEPDMEVAMALAGRRVPVAAGYVGR